MDLHSLNLPQFVILEQFSRVPSLRCDVAVDPANSRNSAIFLNLLVHDPLLSVYECRGSAIGLVKQFNFPAEQVMKQVMKLLGQWNFRASLRRIA